MKYLMAAILLVSLQAQAQWKNFIIGARGDTLNRVDMKGLKQGPWVVHTDDLRGERGFDEQGFYENDKKQGAWQRFSLEGDLIAIENYAYGMKNGKCQYFTNAGEPLREESWRAIDPSNPYDTVPVYDVNDPTKIVRMTIVKIEPMSYKNGTWTYYNTVTGTIDHTEEWVMNREKKDIDAEKAIAGTDDATEKKTEKKDMKKPQAVLDFEKKNAGKHKIKVRDGSTGG